MNKKAIIAIVAVVVVIIGAGAGFALTRSTDEKTTAPSETQTATAQTVTEESTSAESTTAAETSSEAVSESTTEAVSADNNAFVRKGVWFYFDENNREAYAFDFTTDDDDVTITYYNTENIDGEDAKPTIGDGDWKIVDGKLIVDDISSNIDKGSFTFEIKGNDIIASDGSKLENKDKASLGYAYNHFN